MTKNLYTHGDMTNAMIFMEQVVLGEQAGWLTIFKDNEFSSIEDVMQLFDTAMEDFNQPENVDEYGYFVYFLQVWLPQYQEYYEQERDRKVKEAVIPLNEKRDDQLFEDEQKSYTESLLEQMYSSDFFTAESLK